MSTPPLDAAITLPIVPLHDPVPDVLLPVGALVLFDWHEWSRDGSTRFCGIVVRAS